MKKLLIIVFFIFLIFNNNVNAGRWGEGELQLTKNMADYFIKFIRGKGAKKPADFYVTLDGTDGTYWVCTHQNCTEGNVLEDIKDCERKTRKKCAKFAFRRTIKWKNGINPAKGKASTINSKWSDEEIYAKLTELGFYNNDISNFTNTNIETDGEIIYPDTLFYPDKEKKDNWKEFTKYGEGTEWPFAVWAEVRKDKNSDTYSYQWQASKTLKGAIEKATKGCDNRLKERRKKFKNSQICIVHYINGKETTNEEKIKYAKKFYGESVTEKSFNKNNWILTNKVVKKYSASGKRSIALSWDGYDELIAGSVKFDETDYRGTLNIPLPNNDGNCDGTYSLQEGGKGTWQIACTNDMGAAGTLKWTKNGSVTGKGRDHNDKKVKFTVSSKS